jgi:hypothetical protein
VDRVRVEYIPLPRRKPLVRRAGVLFYRIGTELGRRAGRRSRIPLSERKHIRRPAISKNEKSEDSRDRHHAENRTGNMLGFFKKSEEIKQDSLQLLHQYFRFYQSQSTAGN